MGKIYCKVNVSQGTPRQYLCLGRFESRKLRLRVKEMNRYSMVIQWSDEDQLFLVTIPEFADLVVMPCTHGKNREEAVHNGEDVIEMYLEAWQAEGDPIPEPRTLQVA